MAHVLIVDNDRNFRTALQILLSDYGNGVDEAQDAQRSIELVARRTYDVVLTDIDLTGGTGLDVLRALAGKPTRVIVITASLTEELRDQAYRLGAFEYFEKPCEPECLVRAVNEATREASRRRAAYRSVSNLVA